MKIVFLDRKTLGDDITLNQFEAYGDIETFESTSKNQTISRIKNAAIVITNKVVIDKEVIDNTNIKLICVAATGMNNIDLEYASKKGISVKNVAGYSTASVTQLTFSHALNFIQKIGYYDNYVKDKGWQSSEIFTNIDKPFYELDGKKWGIIGLGNIGKSVANVASSFGCEVSYYSTSGKNNNTQYEQKSLEELLKTSDIISIHCALNDSTKDLLNKTNLPMLKDGSILLNLGRGGIVNEQDITDILNSSKDIFFGTDVVTKEPIEANSPLLQVKNKNKIAFTPHIAWASKEARVRLLNGIENNIKDFLSNL